jgi:hypothetical protein
MALLALIGLAPAIAQPAAFTQTVAEPESTALAHERRDLALQWMKEGNTLILTGRVLTIGGLLLSLIDIPPELRWAGVGALALGTPVVGFGAGRITDAAEAFHPEYHAARRGWGYCLTGLALGAVGVSGLAGLETGASPGEVFGGALMLMTGLTLESVAQTKFSNLASEGRDAIGFRAALTPALLLPAEGPPMPGIRLTYRF